MNDHDLLIRIDERVHKDADRMKNIECILEKGDARFIGHDREIDKLKAWNNKATGAVTILGTVLTAIIVWVFKFLGGKG